MPKTFEPAKRMGTNIWNAVRMFRIHYELPGIARNRKKIHSDGIQAHSCSRVKGALMNTNSTFFVHVLQLHTAYYHIHFSYVCKILSQINKEVNHFGTNYN